MISPFAYIATLFLCCRYHQYLSQLTPEQLESIKCVQERRKHSKETVLAKKEKKKELERLGKPKVPENCFLVYAGKLSKPDNMLWKVRKLA